MEIGIDVKVNIITLCFDRFCAGGNSTFSADDAVKAEIRTEPLSLVFLVFFVLVMAIQFLGMIIHRLGTFWHIVASTKWSRPATGEQLLLLYSDGSQEWCRNWLAELF